MSYNGWTNRETWLVNLWYGDALADIMLDDPDREAIDYYEAEEWIRYIAEESETLSQPPTNGLLADFLEQCWASVDWRQIAEATTETIEKEIANE